MKTTCINSRPLLAASFACMCAFAIGPVLFGRPALAQSEPKAAAATKGAITEQEAYEIGVEAYQYFYSLISMDVTRRLTTNLPPGVKPGLGPMNAFHHFKAYPTADFREVIRPNFDTLYSIAWLDLTQEPMIVSAPDTQGRYYLLPMMDMWSDVFAAPGKRTSGTAAGSWAVVPKGWAGTLPDGVQRIESPSAYVWIIGRTQTNGPNDYEAVHKVQAGYTVTPLSRWGKEPKPAELKPDPTVDMKTPPLTQVNTMPAAKYFSYSAELMKLNPPHGTDWSQVARLKRIGIEPGKSFDFDKAPPEVRRGLERATVDGLRLMKEKVPTLARVVNGWQMNTDTMGVYGNYYLKRALVAMQGLGANQPADAIYPMCLADADGAPLDGSKKYVMRFRKEELPPVEAFWSITMYDAEGFQVANKLNRFAIGDRDNLKFNADGSLDIYIQHDSPGADKESNWLPSPSSGTLGITMRLYAPKPEALDGRWNPPAISRTQPIAGLKDPVQIEIENWRGKAFYEILFMNREADGSGVGVYYNSIGLDLEAPNEVMDARFRALDADTLKKEYGGDGIIFNGPRRLVTNSITGGIAWDGGKKRVIGTIPYRAFGIFETPDLDKATTREMPAYYVLTSKRSNSFKFNAGETVYELITPEGAVYTMFSLSLRLDPKNTIENLPTLGERLTLPKGWSFRARKLDQDMILTSTADSNPPNTIVLDELIGNYQYNAGASQQTTPAVPKILSDGAGVKVKHVEGLHKVRFIEIFLAHRDAKTGRLVAECYNPLFTDHGIPASKDPVPNDLVAGIDFARVKQEYGVLGASLNGPKLWLADWVDNDAGMERDFNGIKTVWVAQLDMGDNTGGVSESTPYKPMAITRNTVMGWNKGTTVLLLDDAEGNTWVMKGFQLGLTPKYTYEEFVAAGQSQFKKLPPGWKFRIKTLEKDLIEKPENGVAMIMPDEFFNVYDKTGPGMSNYKP